VVLDHLVFEDDVVHEHLDVRERGDEGARNFGYVRGLAAVDGDRPARDEMARDCRGIVTAPRLGVAPREIAYTGLIECHLGPPVRRSDVGIRNVLARAAMTLERRDPL
jgi:hypothetical protein